MKVSSKVLVSILFNPVPKIFKSGEENSFKKNVEDFI
jgi:hypothetical protein